MWEIFSKLGKRWNEGSFPEEVTADFRDEERVRVICENMEERIFWKTGKGGGQQAQS